MPLWSDRVFTRPVAIPMGGVRTLGVLLGEGVGAEVVPAALKVLAAVGSVTPWRFQVRMCEMPERSGARDPSLAESLAPFFGEVFAQGGAVLAGPVAGRFVYDLRRRLDLFCKLSPLRPWPDLAGAGRLRAEHLAGVDVLVVRENASGVYQGPWRLDRGPDGQRHAVHEGRYAEAEVERIVRVAAGLAADRRGLMTVVIKDGGLPALSELWRDCARAAAAAAGVACRFANVDLAAYLLVQHARDLDVVVAPNLFGDVLADVGGVLLGSRGLTFSGNFAAGGAAVYQTNHGAALDLAGTDRANPVGQIAALAMLLRESFGLPHAAALVEAAVAEVWRQGWRTDDLAEPGCRLLGTRDLGSRIAEATARLGRDWPVDAAPEAAAPLAPEAASRPVR